MMIRRYSRLRNYRTFEERYKYLRLQGSIGTDTFGFDRYINQTFYRSREWRLIRDEVIVRDDGCDLGILGYEIHGEILVHHMNPITPDLIANFNPDILDPEFLITTTRLTHNAMHYGVEEHAPRQFVERKPGDTDLWERTHDANGNPRRVGQF